MIVKILFILAKHCQKRYINSFYVRRTDRPSVLSFTKLVYYWKPTKWVDSLATVQRRIQMRWRCGGDRGEALECYNYYYNYYDYHYYYYYYYDYYYYYVGQTS